MKGVDLKVESWYLPTSYMRQNSIRFSILKIKIEPFHIFLDSIDKEFKLYFSISQSPFGIIGVDR